MFAEPFAFHFFSLNKKFQNKKFQNGKQLFVDDIRQQLNLTKNTRINYGLLVGDLHYVQTFVGGYFVDVFSCYLLSFLSCQKFCNLKKLIYQRKS